jgi:hypothetical protein
MVWDQCSSQHTPKDGGNAKKLSAIKRKPGNPSFFSQTLCPQQPAQQQPSWPQQLNAGHTNKEKKNRQRPNNKGKGHAHTVDGKDLAGLFASPVVASPGSAPAFGLFFGKTYVVFTSPTQSWSQALCSGPPYDLASGSGRET